MSLFPQARKPAQPAFYGRVCLLLIVIFTAVNLTLLCLRTDQYFLFSASLPYYLTVLAKIADGGVNGTYMHMAMGFGLVVMGVYLLCWFKSKKNRKWLFYAMVFFCVDTLVLVVICFVPIPNVEVDIMDFIFHACVLSQMLQEVGAAKAAEEKAE